MKKALLNKKNLVIMIVAVIAILVVAMAVLGNDAARKADDGLPEKTADADNGLPESEDKDHGETYIDISGNWQEENDAKVRLRVKSELHDIGNVVNVVAEIDSKTQPAETSPEATVSVEREGYDLVVRGVLIHGYTNLLVYDGLGNIFDAIRTLSLGESFDEEFRMTNVPAGEYRIVVERLEAEGVSVSCLL
ncbi:MAG: hypothetical protein LBO70_00250, partial [Clostridiales Family XIII bacterium]|nr:hypothetical protein [Clostridiales Family XIII bacterium]